MSAHTAPDAPAATSSLVFWSTAGLDASATSPTPCTAELRCIVVLAAALLSYGLPANRIEESVARLARALGLKVVVFGLPTATLISAPSLEPGLFVARAEPGTIDLSKLEALHGVVAEVAAGEARRG